MLAEQRLVASTKWRVAIPLLGVSRGSGVGGFGIFGFGGIQQVLLAKMWLWRVSRWTHKGFLTDKCHGRRLVV
jgi:hypothetical protein